MTDTKSILLVGVGGQGTILAAKLLTVALMDAGYDVKMSEIHGMSQRGGSVSSQVRYGKSVSSPVIEEGGADILVAFEKMEAMRWVNFLSPKGKAVINNWEINSMPIVTGKVDYPQGILEDLGSKIPTTVIDAAKLATELGNSKVMNVILLGATVKSMGLDTLDWDRIIRDNVKANLADLNIKALKLGMDQIQ
nr:indolepyruvate oxidoreductase subunit beta [uncultured Holophaga sp.]